MLDHTIHIGSTPTFLYFDLYLYSAYAAHYVYIQTYSKNVCYFIILLYIYLNQPYQPRLCVCNSKESLVHSEASKANLDAYKRKKKWQPFFKQVYLFSQNSERPVIHNVCRHQLYKLWLIVFVNISQWRFLRTIYNSLSILKTLRQQYALVYIMQCAVSTVLCSFVLFRLEYG